MATKSATTVDSHVGLRLRERRVALDMSQTALAERVGVTFQQVQKYEKGANRISASKLWDIARFFRVDIGYFFEGLTASPPGMAEPQAEALVHDFPATRQTIEIGRLAPRLSSRQQKLVVDLMRELVGQGEGDGAD